MTKKIAIVESDTPLLNDSFRGNGAFFLNRDQVTLSRGNVRYLTEMRPNRKALIESLITVGFKEVYILEEHSKIKSRYFTSGEKTIVAAIK